MKNNFLYLINFLIFSFILSKHMEDQFNFNVTEIEILNNGNLIRGLKKEKLIQMKVFNHCRKF